MKLVCLAGGVGGSKLAHGFSRLLGPQLSVVVNTGDDFRCHGLHVSPDVDTMLYTLSESSDPVQGWGVAGDTFACMEQLERLGGQTWFRLGDRDLALHLRRTEMLDSGSSLTEVTATMARALGIEASILPMSDQPVRTFVETPEGLLEFQDYFVRRRWRDKVSGVSFRGLEQAGVTPAVEQAIEESQALVLCPSNPLVSIGPILALPGLRRRLVDLAVPKAAVSPIIAGAAVKGPAASMMQSLGHEVSPVGVATMYRDFLDVLFLDEQDRHLCPQVEALGLQAIACPSLMRTLEDRDALAGLILERLGRGGLA